MKNVLRITVNALIVICAFQTSQAQSHISKADKSRIVIATSGLNLRSAPTLNSQIIKLVRYGHEVQLKEEPISTNTDTIQVTNGTDLLGTWIKVDYRGHRGYMFSPFLAKLNHADFPTELLDDNFALLLEGQSCLPNFQYRRDFTYTGIYKTVSGKYRAKKVNVTYSSSDEYENECYSVDTGENEKLLFIVGSRKLPITVSKGQFSYYQNLSEQRNKMMDQVFYDTKSSILDFCHNNVSYQLNENGHKVTSILWRGDLDADGIDDFIIQSEDEIKKIVLYLSSQRQEEKLFKAVAEYYLG